MHTTNIKLPIETITELGIIGILGSLVLATIALRTLLTNELVFVDGEFDWKPSVESTITLPFLRLFSWIEFKLVIPLATSDELIFKKIESKIKNYFLSN